MSRSQHRLLPLKLFLPTALIAVTLLGCGAPADGPIVQSAQGQLQGVVAEGIHVFRHVPYAKPPVGELRWQRPQQPEPWEGVRLAREDGPICEQPTSEDNGNSQFLTALVEGADFSAFGQWALTNLAGLIDEPPMSEDCLSLTIRSPDLEPTRLQPVMLWIHGGGHRFGYGNQGFSDSNALAKRGVVQVNINYRLGIWGYFAHPELVAEDPDGSTGNYGLLDQIAALHWVRDNIERFGGDPNNVTIFGESAGGHSVGQILASPLAQGLVQGAIAQSGTGTYQFQQVHHATEGHAGTVAGQKFAQLAGITASQQLPELRALSVAQIRALENIDQSLVSTYHPQVDGYALPTSVAEIFDADQQAPVPYLIGSNSDEGTVLGLMIPILMDGSAERVPDAVADWDAVLDREIPEIADEYRIEQPRDIAQAHQRLIGDAMFGRHAYYTAMTHAGNGHPTYLYFFERASAGANQTIGATHALDLQPVFSSYFPFWPSDARDDELSAEMGRYWTNFAKTKNPNRSTLAQPNSGNKDNNRDSDNNGDSATDTRAVHWARFDPLVPQELAFGHELTQMRPVARQATYDGLAAQQRRRVERAKAVRGNPNANANAAR